MPRGLRVYVPTPALSLTQATSDKVTIVNPYSFAAGAAFTYCQWVRQRAAPASGQGTDKGSNDFFVFFTNWFANIGRATAASNPSVTDAVMFPDTNLACIFLTYDEANGAKFYRGTDRRAIAELSYASNPVGSGATNANTGDLFVGNRGAGNTLAPAHDIAAIGVFPAVLSLLDMRSWADAPRSIVGRNVGQCWLHGQDGTAGVREASGRPAAGVVTGTSALRAGGPVLQIQPFHRLGRQTQRRLG